MSTILSIGYLPVHNERMAGMGEYIKQKREELGLTQKQVAAVAGTSKEYMSQIESGKPKVPGAALRRGIAEAINVRHVDLLIAAGELREDELPIEGEVRAPFPPGDPRHQLLEALERVEPTREFNRTILTSMRYTLDELGKPKPFSQE